LSLAFSYWTIKPWFLTEGKTCCYIHHTFLLGFPNWPVIYFITTVPSIAITSFLAPRLSNAAAIELVSLNSALATVHLQPHSHDTRVAKSFNQKLSNKDFYVNSFRHLLPDDKAKTTWLSAAPLKCKIFTWLMRRRRLPTNERRHRHQLALSAACPSCPCDEDTAHLIVECHRASEVWNHFFPGLVAAFSGDVEDIWSPLPQCKAMTTIKTAIAWNIWKRRNSLVFNARDDSLLQVLHRCVEDLRLWANRFHDCSEAATLNTWCLSFDPP
jgi:hypothetical protein